MRQHLFIEGILLFSLDLPVAEQVPFVQVYSFQNDTPSGLFVIFRHILNQAEITYATAMPKLEPGGFI